MKIFSIFFTFFYIYINIIFNRIKIFSYTDEKLFFITLILLITELLFLCLLFFYYKIKSIAIIVLNIMSLLGIGLGRMFLIASPIFNDMLSTNQILIIFVGFSRLLYIFSLLMLIEYAFEKKYHSLFIIGILFLINALCIYFDFEMAIIRILIGITFISTVSFHLIKKNKITQGGK